MIRNRERSVRGRGEDRRETDGGSRHSGDSGNCEKQFQPHDSTDAQRGRRRQTARNKFVHNSFRRLCSESPNLGLQAPGRRAGRLGGKHRVCLYVNGHNGQRETDGVCITGNHEGGFKTQQQAWLTQEQGHSQACATV